MISFGFKFLSKSPNNESAWNYVKGMAIYQLGNDISKTISHLKQKTSERKTYPIFKFIFFSFIKSTC